MSVSKYLPPFTAEERVSVSGDRPVWAPIAPASGVAEPEATYADFLGDEVDD